MRAILILFLASISALAASIRIGSEAVKVLPKSAEYSGIVNVRPGDGETVTFNPPAFSWNYCESPTCDPSSFDYFTFQFQISTNADCSLSSVNVRTYLNFYNALAPLDTNGTHAYYWRVGYVKAGVTSSWSSVHSFIISDTPTNWDRSMLADTNYMATNCPHPHLLFNAGNRSNRWFWITNMDDKYMHYSTSLAYATNATNSFWWKTNMYEFWGTNSGIDPNYATYSPADYAVRIRGIGCVLMHWAMSEDPAWTNAFLTSQLVSNINHCARWYNHFLNNMAMADYGNGAGSPEAVRMLSLAYDWLYGAMDFTTRSNVLLSLDHTCLFFLRGGAWATVAVTGGAVNDYTWTYADPVYEPWYGLGKVSHSHWSTDVGTASIAGFAGNQDSSNCMAFTQIMANHWIARGSAYSGFAASEMNRGYTHANLYSDSVIANMATFHAVYPQVGLTNSEFLRRFPEWYSRMIPPFFRSTHETFSDGATWDATLVPLSRPYWGGPDFGRDLSYLSQDGYAYQAYATAKPLYEAFYDDSNEQPWYRQVLRANYQTPPAPLTNGLDGFYPEDGFVVSSSISPADTNCFSDGLGLFFRASPRGATIGHAVAADLGLELFAYGAHLTDGGGGNLDGYGYQPEASDTLFINGYGQRTKNGYVQVYAWVPALPVLAWVVSYTNAAGFVYFCGDGTGLYTNSYSYAQTSVSRMVRRHVLWPGRKYWVIYDEFLTTSPSTFGFRYHVPWTFRHDPLQNILANETNHNWIATTCIISNSFSMLGTTGFTYVANSMADPVWANPTRVKTIVKFINTGCGITNYSGFDWNTSTYTSDSSLNPWTGNRFPELYPRAQGIWVTNTAATTNWHFLTVIYPVKPGDGDPVINRLDDYTVSVDGEVSTFGTNYAGAYNYMVEGIGGGWMPPYAPAAPRKLRLSGGVNLKGSRL